MKPLSFLYKSVSGLIITTLFVGSLLINVTMFTWSTGAVAMSAAFSAMTGVPSVVATLGKQIKTNKNVAGKITKRIAKRTTRGAIRNIASIPAEAVPYLGIPVIIAITALEIKDACETMKDVDELNKQFTVNAEIEEQATKVCGLKMPTI